MKENLLNINSGRSSKKIDISGSPALEQSSTKPQKKDKKINKDLILKIGYGTGILIAIGVLIFLRLTVFGFNPNVSSVINFYDEYIYAGESKATAQYLPERTDILINLPRTEPSPLNGTLYTKAEMDEMMQRRPIAIMVNNLAFARPQSNMTKADVVYETLVESGITRYMPIYWSSKVDEVGPMRSVRNYHLEIVSEYDAILAHDGQAQSADPRLDALGNLSKYGIKTVRAYAAWRWNDGRRYAPHNEYTSPAKIWEYANSRDHLRGFPDIDSWEFKKDAPEGDRGKQSEVRVSFSTTGGVNNQYSVNWIYNNSTNSYLRQVGLKDDIDQKTHTQIEPKVVIVQEANLLRPADPVGRIIMEVIGEGNAKVLQDGKVHSVTWEKKSRDARTIFYNEDGDTFEFNRGQIWIQIIPKNGGDFTITKQ